MNRFVLVMLAGFAGMAFAPQAAFAECTGCDTDVIRVPAGGGGETSPNVGEPFKLPDFGKRPPIKIVVGVPVRTPDLVEDPPAKTKEPKLRSPKVKVLTGYVAGRETCEDSLGGLRAVRASAIRRVEGGVNVAPICARRNLMDQQKGVESIRTAVADNAAMTVALRRAGYAADEVVGVVLDGRGATLYVKAR